MTCWLTQSAARTCQQLVTSQNAGTRHRLLGAGTATYRYRGVRRLQHEQVLTVQLDEQQPEIDGSRRDELEAEDSFDAHWWTAGEVAASGERFYPGRLAALLPRFLAGERIEELFERWS